MREKYNHNTQIFANIADHQGNISGIEVVVPKSLQNIMDSPKYNIFVVEDYDGRRHLAFCDYRIFNEPIKNRDLKDFFNSGDGNDQICFNYLNKKHSESIPMIATRSQIIDSTKELTNQNESSDLWTNHKHSGNPSIPFPAVSTRSIACSNLQSSSQSDLNNFDTQKGR